MGLLTSKLMAPGTKFIVTDDVKDSTFGPGTIGIMSYLIKKNANFENVAHAHVVIIRRGKGGMDRINSNQISFPIFFDKKMLEHKDFLPSEKKYYVNIETVDYEAMDLLKIRPLDFLAWSFAYTTYLRRVVETMAKSSKGVWPSNPGHILNGARRIAQCYDEDKVSTIKAYADDKWRKEFVREARKTESALIRCVLKYKKYVSDITKNAAAFIKFTNKDFYKVAEDKDAEETMKFCDDKSEFIDRMISEKDENAGKSKNFGGMKYV